MSSEPWFIQEFRKHPAEKRRNAIDWEWVFVWGGEAEIEGQLHFALSKPRESRLMPTDIEMGRRYLAWIDRYAKHERLRDLRVEIMTNRDFSVERSDLQAKTDGEHAMIQLENLCAVLNSQTHPFFADAVEIAQKQMGLPPFRFDTQVKPADFDVDPLKWAASLSQIPRAETSRAGAKGSQLPWGSEKATAAVNWMRRIDPAWADHRSAAAEYAKQSNRVMQNLDRIVRLYRQKIDLRLPEKISTN
ncbi:MAG: hypothetical protein GQ539_02265 [Sulfitobacter sp.]|nr:hypothetical protein [Sulfitobacter sp.]